MTSPSFWVEEATEVTASLVSGFARLLPQLSRSAAPLGEDDLEAIVQSTAVVLLVARCDADMPTAETGTHDEVIGSLTLVLFPIPTGIRAWVEDVVVDEAWRGRGVGAELTRVALERATSAGARTVDLTSRPSRKAANRLYLRLGFEQRDTNVYRCELPT
ncbi:MAG: GNAT family N-acetyltransferase [Pseudonocardiaceae bacterium]